MSRTDISTEPDAEFFRFDELTARRAATGRAYLEFLRVPAVSAGLYVLPAGGTDGQQPHTEDEVYVVMAGRARFQAGKDDRTVEAGDVIYVRRGVEHRFHAIEEELRVLVLFAPAEYSRAASMQA
jgi:quercetin dioxygenase-like cupin family protein